VRVPALILFASCLEFASLPAVAQVSVLTYHNNNQRTGLNTNETILNLTNVTSTRFGKLFTCAVDGCVYAQPLYVPNLNIAGQGKHNVLFIATENSTVYAFDANSAGASGGLLWETNLGAAVLTTTATFTNKNFGTRYNGGAYTDIIPKVSITGTPVIDTNSGTLYVDEFIGIVGGGVTNYCHYLHALNITNGTELSFSPVVVTASVAGTGVDSVNGKVTFNAKQENQRCALTLLGGIVYVAYAGYADTDPYHGWIIGFSTTNLAQLTNYVFNTTPNATTATFGANAAEGGLWMGGGGLCVDNNSNIFFMVGNGSFSATNNSGNTDYGDSFIKLTTTNGLAVADYFTPWNQTNLQANDTDLGSGGLMLLPDQTGTFPHEMLGAGKQGQIYVINRDQFTTGNNHYDRTNVFDFIVQTNLAQIKSSFDTPAYFNGRIYYAASGDNLKAIAVTNGALADNTILTNKIHTFNFPGATPSISANRTNNGIVWAIQMPATLGNPGTLIACNATNVATELYTSTNNVSRDQLGAGVKFAVPTVADGEVFVGTSNSVSVFGLLAGTFSFGPAAYSVKESSTNVTITVNRIGGTNGAVQISYATAAGGTAQNGVDYTGISGVLNWTNGESVSKSFSVPVLGNSMAQSNVTVNLALSNPTNSASALGTQPTAVLTINLSTPLLSSALTATAIMYGQTLANSTLGGIFTNAAGATVAGTLAFVNLGLEPKAGTTNVPVIFIPTDTTDYNNITNLVSVMVNMATPLASSALSATAITFGQTLSNSIPSETFTNVMGVTVPGTLAFVNPGIVPKAGVTNVQVSFTSTDAADYNNVTNTMSVTVNLATPTISSALTATAITYGQILASSTLGGTFTNATGVTVPGTLAFVNPGLVPKAGITNVQVSFTPSDKADYNSVTNTVSVTVNIATPTATLAVVNTPVTYDGTGKAASVGITVSSVPGSVANILTGGAATQTNAGTYAVTADFVPTDTTNYTTLTGVSAGNFVINLATLEFAGLSSLTNTYGVTNIILSGELSGSGPVYPASGGVVSVTINGIAVSGTVTNNTGGFWINYNDPSLATNGAAGSPYTITYGYAGNAGNGLASAADSSTSLTINEPPSVTWKLTYFGTNAGNPVIAGDLADPSHDGIANLLAYAYAFNPLVANTNPFTSNLAGKQFQIHFPRNTSASDITYVLQTSTSLTTWISLVTFTAVSGWVTNAPPTTVAESATNGVPPGQYVNVTVTSSTNVTANATNQFLRLQIHR
jgi:hypothetical protein